MPVDRIRNLRAVDARVASAGQPTEAELRDVARAGYRAVINLGLSDAQYSLADEASSVTSLGLAYRHVPVRFEAPRAQDFDAFVSAMDDLAGARVFVHCASNYRASCFLALYGELRLGWTTDEADEHIRKVWTPDVTWWSFVKTMRQRWARPAVARRTQRRGAILVQAIALVAVVFASGSAADAQVAEPKAPGQRMFINVNLDSLTWSPAGGVRPAIQMAMRAGPSRQSASQRSGPRARSKKRIVAGAIVGGIGGFFAGGFLGAHIEGDRCDCDDPGVVGFLIGAPIGAVAGGIAGAKFLF